MQNRASEAAGRWFTFDRIATVVADHYSVSIADMRGPRSYQSLTMPRRVTVFLLRETGASWTEIGRYLHRHHTTVLMHWRNITTDDIPPEIRVTLAPVGTYCESCRSLRLEMAALKLEIMELRHRFGGGNDCE